MKTIWRWWEKTKVPLSVFKKLVAARRAGVINPLTAYREAKHAGLDYALACSMLFQETGGGHNEFGHDPTIFVGAGNVTKSKYLEYKRERIRSGNMLMQGVGPMQLTWWSTQDRADALGGAWIPRNNMRVGFDAVAGNIRRDGLHAGIAAYNGSGPAANRYADEVLARAQRLRSQGV